MSELKNSNNQSENTEKQNKKKESIWLLSISQKEFIDFKLEKDLNYFSGYSFERNIFDDFSLFLKWKEAYSDLFLSLSEYSESKKIALIHQLKNEVLKVTSSRNLILKNVEETFFNNYDFTDRERGTLSISLKKVWNWELSILSKYDSKRIDFLLKSKIFTSKEETLLKKKKINETFLNDIKISKEKFDSLSDEDKEILFWLYHHRNTISISDLDVLLNIFDDNESKNKLIKYFFNSISYSDLEKNNILTPSIKEKVYWIFKKELKNISPNISEKDSLDIFEYLDKDDFFVDIRDLDVDFSELLNDKHFKANLVSKYNEDVSFISEIDQSIISKLTPKWQNEDINDSFIDFVEKDESISSIIRKSIKNLHENNIIKLSQTDSNWNTESVYFKISKVDNWANAFSKTIILENITTKWWIRKDFKWTEVKFWYQGFYDLLKDYSWENAKTSKLSIHKKEDLVYSSKTEVESDSSDASSKTDISDDLNIGEKVREIVPDDEIDTLIDLTSKLDFLDPDWKNIEFLEWKVSILSKDENFVFSITKIDEWNKKITIDQQWSWAITIGFQDFYNAFKESEWKFTRIKQYNNFNDILSIWLDTFNWLSLWWSNNDKIISKTDAEKNEVNKSNYQWIKYFVWENWEAIYVHEISNDKIKYNFWEVKEWENASKDQYDFDKWYLSTSFTQFFQDISKFKMTPKHNVINSKTEEEKKWEKSLKWSLASKFLSGMSIADLLVAAKFFPDNIKKNMERWNRLKALKFAQKVAWVSWKNSSFYLSMKSSAEQEEKNLTEEIVWNLKSLWSKDMIKQVKKILLNKNSEEYELIAAMMCIVWKYWTLYPKDLKEFSWSMIWYRRLWWTDWYLNEEREKIKNYKSPSWKPNPVFFNEERLVESWLWKRSKDWNIRSRIDKDFWNALAWGIKEEMEDWAMKAWNKVTIQWRVDYFVDELKNLWYPNAIWSLEKIFWKNWPSQDMNAAPFVLTITWLWEKLDQVLLNKIIWVAYSTPFSTLAFNSSKEDIKLYQDFIWAVINDENIPRDKWASWMKDAYDKLLKESDSSKKVKSASEFWSKYGKYLINHINLSDPYTILKRKEEGNEVYNSYYETLKWIHSDWEFNVSDDDIIHWVYDKNPIIYTSWKKDEKWNYYWIINKIKTDTSLGITWQIGKSVYNMYITSIENIKKDELSTIDEKKQLFKEVFWFFSDYIKATWWQYSTQSKSKSPFFYTMTKELWVTIQYDELYPNRDVYLDIMFENFMKFKKDGVDDVKTSIKTNIEDTINKRAINDDLYDEYNQKVA